MKKTVLDHRHAVQALVEVREFEVTKGERGYWLWEWYNVCCAGRAADKDRGLLNSGDGNGNIDKTANEFESFELAKHGVYERVIQDPMFVEAL